MKRKAESESNEGDDSPTCNDRSLVSNNADIDPHPTTLPPTNTIGTKFFVPSSPCSFRQKMLERRFARCTSCLIMAKRMTRNSNLCCKKNVNVRQTLTWKQSVPTFPQVFTHKLSHKLRLAYWLAKGRVCCAGKYWRRLCTSAKCLRPNDRQNAQQAH